MPVITEISYQKKNKSRVNIYLDGEFACGMQAIVAMENRLKVGMQTEADKLKELSEISDIEAAFNKAVKLISKVLKTEHELKNYLIEKGYLLETVNKVIEKLKEYNYINDEEYALAYINEKKQQSGKKKLYYELKQKGISDKILDKAINSITKKDEEEVIIKLANKYIKGKVLDIKIKKNLANYLYSRGFEWDDYIDVIEDLFGDGNDD